jgi:hypothetical protein
MKLMDKNVNTGTTDGEKKKQDIYGRKFWDYNLKNIGMSINI